MESENSTERGDEDRSGQTMDIVPMERIVVEEVEDSVLLPSLLSDPTILVPKIGQTFDEDPDGYAFYNLYARFTGFGIRRSKNRFKDGGVKSMQEFCCIREVLVQYGFTEIPKKYILKRWTKDARDCIPKHLEESYLNDKEAAASRTYRNTLLHKSILDLVRLGGTSAETYEKTVEVLTKLVGELKVMSNSQEANNNEIRRRGRTLGKKPAVESDDSSDSKDSMSDGICVGVEDDDGEDVSADEDFVVEDMIDVNEEDILPPEVRRSHGRPRSTRLMSKGETSSKAKKKVGESTSNDESMNHAKERKQPTKQIRYCKLCGGHGHYRNTCGRKSSYERKK
ncbi:hypothetical protein OsI_07419 [Oryza sativa Indica Group]|uniref:Protein FAR1-RELATED SEQUENCE n=1 Tax=Oryza sativa subsp. indica TaxID=39946 RepID=A2X5E2_ORYSI|nr:hypothetical protein OsI_07419 [Oryza sativa Indica Group]